jgi:hypothetical protein
MPSAPNLSEHATRRFDRGRFASNRKLILSAHRLGSDSLDEAPEIPYRKAPVLAKERKVTVARLGFARQFANTKKKGFTEKSLRRSLDKCEKAGFMVGVQHFALLITLESSVRESFLDAMIQARWTLAEAKRQVRLRYGLRRHGGRQPSAPKDLTQFWTQLQSRLMSLNRWRNIALELFKKSPELLSRAGVADALLLLDEIEVRSAKLSVAANRAIKAAPVSKKKKPPRKMGRHGIFVPMIF